MTRSNPPDEARSDIFGLATSQETWLMIAEAARRERDSEYEAAWRTFVSRFERPIRACLLNRLRGHPHAEECADEFLAYLCAHHVLEKAVVAGGKFRAYIQGVIWRYVSDWKRANPVQLQSSSEEGGEPDYEIPRGGGDEEATEAFEESAWADELLRHALESLVRIHPRDGQLLKQCYALGSAAARERDVIAREAGITANTLNQALFRMRKELARLVLEELRSLCVSDEDFEAERDALLERLLQARPGLLTSGAD